MPDNEGGDDMALFEGGRLLAERADTEFVVVLHTADCSR